MQKKVCCAGLMLFCWLSSCAPSYTKYITTETGFNRIVAPDYTELQNWAAHPGKTDVSDSIPYPLLVAGTVDTTAAVFFIHPTTLTSNRDTSWNASLDNDTLNSKTDYSTILYQSTAFNAYSLFAPRYRQAHLRSYYTTDTARAKMAFDLAYEDVKAAFLQFILMNDGKPFVIAAHSQGSTHAIRLLQEFFQDGRVKDKLVVAYILGMHIPSLGTLQLCKDSIQTGCVCAWRTFKAGYTPSYIKNETGPAFVTNPLTWQTSTEFVSRSLNRGAIIRDFNTIYPRAADAQIEQRVLWVQTLRFPGHFLLRTKNYHAGDINLFYVNIRQNLETRIKAFLAK